MTSPHPVLELIARRATDGSRPGRRTDRHRLALVVEGGAMRGIVSSAMADVIEELGLLDTFDLVAGTSSGALNAAALLARVARGCTTEYAEGFVTREFINPWRLLAGRPAISADRVLDYHSEHLDADRHHRTLTHDIPLHCVATPIDDPRAFDLTDFTSLEDLRGGLLATSRLPWLGGEPVEFRGRWWVDGGLIEPVPLPTVLAAGATHVLALLTRPDGEQIQPQRGFMNRLVERKLRRLNPALVDRYRERPAAYGEVTDRIMAETRLPSGTRPFLYGINLPYGSRMPSRLERNAEVLTGAAEAGRVAARRALGAVRDVA